MNEVDLEKEPKKSLEVLFCSQLNGICIEPVYLYFFEE